MMSNCMPVRSAIVVGGSALILGACVNIVVLVVLSLFVDAQSLARRPLGQANAGFTRVSGWIVETGKGLGLLRVFAEDAAQLGDELSSMGLVNMDMVDVPGSSLPGPIRRELYIQPQRAQSIVYDSRGWPFLTAWCEYRRDWPDPIQDRVHGGIPLDYEDRRGGGGISGQVPLPRSIPFRPIWIGVFLNTVFYAIMAIAAIALVRKSRWLWRIHEDSCPACGYRLVGRMASGCPECGWNRPTNEEHGS